MVICPGSVGGRFVWLHGATKHCSGGQSSVESPGSSPTVRSVLSEGHWVDGGIEVREQLVKKLGRSSS